MKLILEQTDKIVTVNGVPARVWEGVTGNGVEVSALITRIAAHKNSDCSQLESELTEQRPPSPELSHAFPMRLIL